MKVIIFDYDGTLADSRKIATEVVNSVYQKYGLAPTRNEEEFAILYDNNFFEASVARGLDAKKIPQLIHDLNLEISSKWHKVKLFPDVKENIEELARDNTLLIISSNMSKIVKKSLEAKNIEVFQDILGADIDTNKVRKINFVKEKYTADKYILVCDTTGDIKEGKKAKVITIGVTWGFHNKKRIQTAKPDFVVTNWTQLAELLNAI